MRIISGQICRDCIYFDPDLQVCQLETEYRDISEFHHACNSFASDNDDIIDNPRDYSISNLYDEEDDNDYYDDI